MTSDNTAASGAGTDAGQAENSIAAALTAAGIGCLAMGILTTLSEASTSFSAHLNLYKPVGPLSGKSLFAVAIWLAAWSLLSRLTKGKTLNINRWMVGSIVCVVLGLITTFPPFFDLLGDK